MQKKTKQKNRGITLIALVITIIILIILAGISIVTLTGDNGILNKARLAKEETELANEKEIVERATLSAMADDKDNIIKKENLEKELEVEAGQGKTKTTEFEKSFEILFIESNRYYFVDKNGNVSEAQEKVKDANPGDITISQSGTQLDGSKEHPYEITSMEDLLKFSQMANQGENFNGKYIKLMNNLNFKSTISYNDAENTSLFGDYNGDKVIEGILDEVNNENATGLIPIKEFYGTLMGDNKEISDIFIKKELNKDDNIIGLTEINAGTIENLTLTGNIKFNVANGEQQRYCIGSVAGWNEGSISNVKNEMDIEGATENGTAWLYIGGITGRSENIIDNCINLGNMNIGGTSDNRVGGIVGYITANSKVTNSHNRGNIRVESTDYACIGGINLEAIRRNYRKLFK